MEGAITLAGASDAGSLFWADVVTCATKGDSIVQVLQPAEQAGHTQTFLASRLAVGMVGCQHES